MIGTAFCPQCRESVSLPSGASPAARVRCPCCRGEYALSEAIEYRPPLLELVEAVADEPHVGAAGGQLPVVELGTVAATEPSNSHVLPGIESSSVLPAAVHSSMPPPSATPGEGSRVGDSGVSVFGSEPAAADDGAGAMIGRGEHPAAATKAETPPLAEMPGGGTPGLGQETTAAGPEQSSYERHHWEPLGAAQAGTASDPATVATAPGAQAAGLPWPPFPAEPPAAAPESAAIRTGPARKRPQGNMAIELAKTLLGGVAGLMIAYLILLWFGRDPLKLGPTLPRWLVPQQLEAPADETNT